MKIKNLLVLLVLALLALLAVGCHKPHNYDTNVEITRIATIRKDEQGKPLTMDVEFSYFECPGTQVEVMRGGKEFAECVQSNVKLGDKVPIKLEHHWDPEGHFDYDVFEVKGCKRPPDPNDEAGYKMVRECFDWNVNGTRVGFQCNYTDKKDLNKKCPWFKKR
jgi:hypothetical protein